MDWIGATISVVDGDKAVSISVPVHKCNEVLERATLIQQQAVIQKRELRSFCGQLSFIAGLVCFLRPFLSQLWAAIAEHSGKADVPSDAPGSQISQSSRKRSRRLPHHQVFVRQFAHSLLWIIAFFEGQLGPLVREFPLEPFCHEATVRIATDASPWGIGGVLLINNEPAAWFADQINTEDLRRFNATRGESGFNTLWEALAILVGIRLWRSAHHRFAQFEIRSDSMGALSALNSLSSSSASINTIARELALDSAQLLAAPSIFAHTPGVANILPDKLSRLWAPEAYAFPECLASVPGGIPPRRGHSFWRSCGAPKRP